MDEVVLPELVHRVFDELDEGYEEAPRVRAVHDEPLEQHSGDLLLDGLRVGLREQIKQCT